MDSSKHVTVLALLFVVFGLMSLMLGIGFIKGFAFIGSMLDDSKLQIILGSFGSLAGTILIVFAIPTIVAGIGLLNYKSWARTLALIVCIVKLFSIPFGTIFGVYGIWVLMQDEAIALLKK